MEQLETIIASHPFWKGAAPAHITRLAGFAQIQQHGVGDLIFQERQQADHLCLLHRGHVALEAFLPGTGVTTVAMLGAGEALGWSWLFEPFRWQYSARSVDATEVVVFSAARLREMSESDPEFGRELVTRMAQVLMQRLQAERFKLREMHSGQHPPVEDVLSEPDEESEAATHRSL
ncbi:MAG: cyclic nucleotide-binding domain-containing protein [Verrucomicrobiales bacterium]|nr:cyclic nucleotide-binding domain-containing protein [Verrucomicrobiales bacterium]